MTKEKLSLILKIALFIKNCSSSKLKISRGWGMVERVWKIQLKTQVLE